MKSNSDRAPLPHAHPVYDWVIRIAVIIVTLAVLAPQIQTFLARGRTSEVYKAAFPCRDRIANIIENTEAGKALPRAGQWGCEQAPKATLASQYIDRMFTTDNGTIMIKIQTFGSAITSSTDTLSLAPCTEINGNSCTHPVAGKKVNSWRCGNVADGTSMKDKYQPDYCRGALL